MMNSKFFLTSGLSVLLSFAVASSAFALNCTELLDEDDQIDVGIRVKEYVERKNQLIENEQRLKSLAETTLKLKESIQSKNRIVRLFARGDQVRLKSSLELIETYAQEYETRLGHLRALLTNINLKIESAFHRSKDQSVRRLSVVHSYFLQAMELQKAVVVASEKVFFEMSNGQETLNIRSVKKATMEELSVSLKALYGHLEQHSDEIFMLREVDWNEDDRIHYWAMEKFASDILMEGVAFDSIQFQRLHFYFLDVVAKFKMVFDRYILDVRDAFEEAIIQRQANEANSGTAPSESSNGSHKD